MKQQPSLKDYVSAFYHALKLTLRGETIPTPVNRYPELQVWIEQAVPLTKAAFAAASANGLDESARKSFKLHLEGRDISMQTILGAVEHNLTREYPLLLKAQLEHNLTALYAFNLDDRYRVLKLVEALHTSPPVQTAVQALGTHLNNIPSSPKE